MYDDEQLMCCLSGGATPIADKREESSIAAVGDKGVMSLKELEVEKVDQH